MGLLAAPAPGPDVTPPDPKPAPHGCLLTPSPDPSTLVLAGPGEESVEVTTPVAVNPHPPRTATFSRRVRSLLTLVASSQCSGRIDATRPAGCPALSISELVEMRPAARNLESGSLVLPASASTCSFSVLESIPICHLAKVANNSRSSSGGNCPPPP
ncbi:hypothetical protein ZWY2020_054618 [Hordeum vulgare]|nr:hypothetical protein ZWY2020_054618 [Hordeum vulgare]